MYTYHPNCPAPPKQKDPSDTELLLDLTLCAGPFLSTGRRAFVRLALGDEAFQVLPARSPALRDWLIAAFFRDHERVPRERAVRSVLRTLEALAYTDPREPEHVGLRLAARGDRVFLDLANDSGEAVEITSSGWEIVQGVYHYFLRSRSTGAHPRPVNPSPQAEPLAPLRALLPLAAPRDWHRCLAWLISAFRPTGPYPVLVLQGPPGAGKSLAAALLGNLVDPSPAPFTPPGADRQVLAAASDRWVPAFDHVSRLSTRLSDTISRLSSGAAFSLRDNDGRTPIPLHLQRPVILTRNSAELRDPALADRALVVNLKPPERRRAESDLRAEFDNAQPFLLGALCTAVSTALRRLPDTKVETASRFPDAAAWAAAAAPALGLTEQEILDAFGPDQDPILPPIATLMRGRDSWTGPAAELLDLLPPEARPANPRALSHRLRRSAAAFSQAGFRLTFRHTHHGRPITITAAAQASAPISQPTLPRWDRIRRWPKKKNLLSASKPVLPSWRRLSSSSRVVTFPSRPPCRPLRGESP